jgi:hypothetical protein
MFRALLAHPQEAVHKQQLVYCVRVMSVGCYQDWCISVHTFRDNADRITEGAKSGTKALLCVA